MNKFEQVKDDYDTNHKKRMKRSQSGVKDVSDDIGYIIDKVDSADYVRLDICRDRSKRYFAIALAKEYKIARDTDIMMTLDNVLEVYNCALECTINKYR